MDFKSHRPQVFSGKGDKYLKEIARGLKRLLIKAQNAFTYSTLRLSDEKAGELSSALVEFAEDIHNGIGIWKSLEYYNLEFFGTPLPLILQQGESKEEKELNKYRIWHLLWVLYSELKPGLILSPTHQDLSGLVEPVSQFLETRFKRIPKDSGIKAFLSQPNKYGWDVKRKLIWLGQHSYLFRHNFENYALKENEGKADIPTIDDFICQENTSWSGLGVIDILAALLNITEKQRSDLRSWYERHRAFFRVLAVNGPEIEMMNLINDKPYTVMAGEPNPFKVRQVVFGGLVPWDDKWYWSGDSNVWDALSEKEIMELKDNFLQKASRIAYRYCDQLAQKARDMAQEYYETFVKYHGDDLVIYPDGRSMTEDWQREMRQLIESRSQKAAAEKAAAQAPEKRKIEHPLPKISLPPEIMETKNGIGVYYNPTEGQEIVPEFNFVISGLKKKGINLDKAERELIEGIIVSDDVSPGFIKKLVRQYGDESIAAVFLMDRTQHPYYLNYLLRRYKGHFYRNRYPSISFV
jgi:hypothetical protein